MHYHVRTYLPPMFLYHIRIRTCSIYKYILIQYLRICMLEAHFVHLSIGAVGLQHLGCHVVERPTPRVLQYARAVVLQLGGDAEVD